MKTTCQRALFLLDKPVFLICFLCLYSLSHLLHPAQLQGEPSLVSVSCQAARRLASSPGRTQPGVSPNLFLALKPLLKSGYKYHFPPHSLAISMLVPARWGIQTPTPLQPQSTAGIWASFPAQKKVPVHPSGVHLYNK